MVTVQNSGAQDYLITLYKTRRTNSDVNTFHLGYKNQSVYAVSGTSRCLFRVKLKTQIQCGQGVQF